MDGVHSMGVDGVAVVLMKAGCLSMYVGVHLVEASHHLVLDMEIAAIHLAIHMASNLPPIDGAAILSDSQQVICLLDPTLGTPTLALANDTRKEL